MRSRKRAKDRRLERRLARKVTKTGEKYAPEVYQAYLSGMQRGMEIKEQQRAEIEAVPYQDIFGNPITSMKMREIRTEDAICAVSASSPSANFH
ncbi:hypothetical protein JYU29_14710 [Tianweitania sp. BSSL-BM11]|uniref:Uncharacterized protein n=1 Tax=Tianweitania aestuarii TaxID=2814886 RepID=A0ABS5RYU5_9HYPH|nr:hypothetical protein [Tianweitania aestuarii]MBS9721940.1 hypothetical protein [Tianweitania aestuarii]